MTNITYAYGLNFRIVGLKGHLLPSTLLCYIQLFWIVRLDSSSFLFQIKHTKHAVHIIKGSYKTFNKHLCLHLSLYVRFYLKLYLHTLVYYDTCYTSQQGHSGKQRKESCAGFWENGLVPSLSVSILLLAVWFVSDL